MSRRSFAGTEAILSLLLRLASTTAIRRTIQNSQRMLSYLLSLTLTLAACFAAQSYALRAVGGRTLKSESNFFSSIGRIQAGAVGRPEIMVLGSSITGRLPDRAQGFPGVANMGCDGGSAVDALRAMDQGILPIAPWIVIEANTLHLALKSEPTEISKAMRGLWFRTGMKFPSLSSYARPSAFFYSKLLAKRTGDTGTVNPTDNLGVASKPAKPSVDAAAQLTEEQEALAEEISGILHRMEAKGSRFLIAWLPPARSDGSPPPPWILETARRGRALWWDAGQEAAPGTVTLTDGVHMAAPSAARTMVSLLNALDRR
jgi:hypothetical protein